MRRALNENKKAATTVKIHKKKSEMFRVLRTVWCAVWCDVWWRKMDGKKRREKTEKSDNIDFDEFSLPKFWRRKKMHIILLYYYFMIAIYFHFTLFLSQRVFIIHKLFIYYINRVHVKRGSDNKSVCRNNECNHVLCDKLLNAYLASPVSTIFIFLFSF